MKPSNTHLMTQANDLRGSDRQSRRLSERSKKLILSVVCALAFVFAGQAQARYAIVDTKYILDKVPEYKDAQKRLDQTSMQWQKEIDDKQSALDILAVELAENVEDKWKGSGVGRGSSRSFVGLGLSIVEGSHSQYSLSITRPR